LLLNPNRIPEISPFFEKKKCEDLGVDQNLTEFTKIPMLESLKFFFINFYKKINIKVF